MGTEATRLQSLHYGCMVTNKMTHEVTHYVEKPSSYVSALINCGIYVCSLDIFQKIGQVFVARQQEKYDHFTKEAGYIQLEQEILTPLAGTGQLYAFQMSKWWSQLKTAGSAIYANRHYLQLYHEKHPERLKKPNEGGEECTVHPDVHIDPSAVIHPSAVVILQLHGTSVVKDHYKTHYYTQCCNSYLYHS